MTPSRRRAPPAPLTSEMVAQVLADLQRGKPVRRRLPGSGTLYLDRPLPFLCLYRQPPGRPDPGTRRLVTCEAAYLAVRPEHVPRRDLARLVEGLATYLRNRLGGFLLVEVWAGEIPEEEPQEFSPRPAFTIHAGHWPELTPTVTALREALGRVRLLKHRAQVTVERRDRWSPPGLPPILSPAQARRIGCDLLGVEVRPIHHKPEEGYYPPLLRRLQRQHSIALRRGLHSHAVRYSTSPPVSYQVLGRRRMARRVWNVDAQLAEIATSYDFLLEVTPVNLHAAWTRFRRHRCEREPIFHYRPLPVDPLLIKRRLHAIEVEKVEEPTLAQLFREQAILLDRELTMLLDRGTARFLQGSLQIFGGTSDALHSLAEELIRRIPARGRQGRQSVDADGMAARAREEVERYRGEHPDFEATVQVRDDLYNGLMVSRGHLFIGRHTRIPTSRVEALLQHEIGTHSLTYQNARIQPLRLLRTGLSGYDELQEGLAVLSEYLVGGLSRARLRLLAARVVAAHLLEQGASFLEAFRALHRERGFNQNTAFTVVARTWRGGGLTKDAVYLRGLAQLLAFLGGGGALEPLFVGKIAAQHVPMVEELQLRRVLKPAPLWPRYVRTPDAQERLMRLREGRTVLDLLKEARP